MDLKENWKTLVASGVIAGSIAWFFAERTINYVLPYQNQRHKNVEAVNAAISAEKEIDMVYEGKRYRLESVIPLRAGKSYIDHYVLRSLTNAKAPSFSVPTNAIKEAIVIDGGRETVIGLSKADVEKDAGIK